MNVSPALPLTFGGKFTARSQVDFFSFEGLAGQTIVLDVAAKRVGSKASVVVWLLDASGRTLAPTGIRLVPPSRRKAIIRSIVLERDG